MFQKIFFFVFIFLLVIIQSFFIPNFFQNGGAPSLIALVIIFWTIKYGFERTIKIAIFSGFFLDIFFFWPIGVNIISLVSISFLTSYLAKRFFVADFFSRVFWVIIIITLATVVGDFLSFSIFEMIAFFKKGENSQMVFNLMIWKEVVCNIVLFMIIYWPIKKIESFLSMYKQKTEPKYYVK